MLEIFGLVAGLIVIATSLWANAFRKRAEDEVDDDYRPRVTVITPMFNEGEAIRKTIESLVAQDYPAELLDFIVVDDCSTDDSYEHAKAMARANPRVRVLRNSHNMGKRKSINRAVVASDAEIVVSVDSDVIVREDAVRQLVRRFVRDDIAAVGGRVDISNKRQNWLTRMQAVKYYYGYHSLKNMERAFRSVMCLSGCLTAYRRDVLLELEGVLENREVLGVHIKYGEDRFLTRQIIKAGYNTTMTCDAVCKTGAPDKLIPYFSQQLRWRRSNLVDYLGSFSHIWRIHPVVAICYYAVFTLFISYPLLLLKAASSDGFWGFMSMHVVVVLLFGVFHRLRTIGKEPARFYDFLPMAITMPVTYGLLPVVALFTLDSSRWETRNHEEAEQTQSFSQARAEPSKVLPVPPATVGREVVSAERPAA